MRGPHDLSTILVVDLEATCWEGPPPFGQSPEVIEIGMVRLTPAGLSPILPGRRIRPEKSRVSPFCTQLTGRTQEDVDRGEPLGRATKRLVREGTLRYTWAPWGAFDRTHLRDECDLKGVWFPFSDAHLHIKDLHAFHRRLPKGVGLGKALAMEGLEFRGTPHRAVYDAYNAGRILARLLQWAPRDDAVPA